MLTGILIDVVAKTVTEIELDKGLQPMYDAIGCSMVEVTDLGGADLWTDEEGRLKSAYIDDDGIKHNMNAFTFPGFAMPYMGNGLILGHNGDGESTNSPVSVEQVKALVTFVEYDNPQDIPQPSCGFVAWDF